MSRFPNPMKSATGVALTALLAGCGSTLPLLGAPDLGREAVEAEVRARLAGSEVSTFWLDKQPVGWVDANLPARLGEPLNLVASGRRPEEVVWVALVEGTLSPAIWPHRLPSVQVTGFSRALMLMDTKTAQISGMFAKPVWK